MRASRSWPRSSVPNGWAALGPCVVAEKSIASIGMCHANGPSTTAATSAASTPRLKTAMRCRRKLRQASPQGDTGLSVRDAGIEEAIEQVGDQVEDDHQHGKDEGDAHDDRRVVAQDRIDQQR